MRELARDEYAPTLAFAAAVLELAVVVFAYILPSPAAVATMSILLAPVATLLVLHVHAEPWARMGGYAWAGLELLTGVTALFTVILGGDPTPAATLAGLALLAAAVWVFGASMADDGAGRSLGGAAAIAVAFVGVLDIAESTLARVPWTLGRYVRLLAVVLFVAWLVVLGRDLTSGRRRWRAVA